MKDPDFLADAAKMNLEVNPMRGQDVARLIADLYTLPKDTGDKARRAMGMD